MVLPFFEAHRDVEVQTAASYSGVIGRACPGLSRHPRLFGSKLARENVDARERWCPRRSDAAGVVSARA